MPFHCSACGQRCNDDQSFACDCWADDPEEAEAHEEEESGVPMKFHPGDKVRCVHPSTDGGARFRLDPDGVYTVERVIPDNIKIEGSPWFYREDRFEIVNHSASRYTPGSWLHSLSSDERKECAVSRGLFAYFPDALVMIARHSVRANEKHNPGQPVHWAREKSPDHEDCIARHSISVAIDPDAMDGDVPHIVCRAWRALAALQVWIEKKQGQGDEL